MLKYKVIINMKLEEIYMINIEKIDNIAASRKYPPTPPQWQAIAITGADVLVAAAAGSGKTEVLSERIARKVATKRWDIDRLLVLTFTTAAAKNMIVRIEDKISERLLSTNKEEDLLFLRKQRMLMNDAYVSTIDSFCLNVLKKFYYLVEEKIDNQIKYLSPNFGILANSKGLLSETIGNVLEELVKDEGIGYVENNFQYSILENYNGRIDDKIVLRRESWWKEVLQSRQYGYNAN